MMQKLGKTNTIALAAVALVVAAGFLLLWWQGRSPSGAYVHIWVGGQPYRTIELANATPGVFSIEQDTGRPVSFEIKDNRIRFINVTCPDHLCEQVGFVHTEGQTAICMPNQVVLSIEPTP